VHDTCLHLEQLLRLLFPEEDKMATAAAAAAGLAVASPLDGKRDVPFKVFTLPCEPLMFAEDDDDEEEPSRAGCDDVRDGDMAPPRLRPCMGVLHLDGGML
jgi:hypothetical protein